MASLNTIARPYAKAIFEIACESKTLVEWGSVLQILKRAIEDKDLRTLLKNPAMQASDWIRLLLSLCEELAVEATRKISNELRNCLALLLDRSRLIILSEISDVFHAFRLKEEGIVEVDMLSPYPVADQELARFQHLLAKRFGGVTIQLKSTIDPSLIGGAVLRSGDWVMDGSVKRKLARLSESLSQPARFEETN
jgi:F-type H+-transporting ATPase subunit delta